MPESLDEHHRPEDFVELVWEPQGLFDPFFDEITRLNHGRRGPIERDGVVGPTDVLQKIVNKSESRVAAR